MTVLQDINTILPSGHPELLTAAALRSILTEIYSTLAAMDSSAGTNVQSFGAIGDGVTDDTLALQQWLNSIPVGGVGYLPAATYRITAGLTINTSQVTIIGVPYQTIINYAGASTTTDIFAVGNGVSAVAMCSFSGIKITSNTVMTGGAAFHFRGVWRSQCRDLVAAGQDSNGNLYHGFWFDQVDFVRLDNFESHASADGLRVNGSVSLGEADLFVRGGKIGSCGVGIRVGGSFGGLVIDDTDIIANGTNMVVDQSITATANREIFLGKGVLIDSSTSGPGLQVSDTGAGFIFLTGTWIASNHTHGLQIDSGVNMSIVCAGGTIYNNTNDGIHDATSATAQLDITGTRIAANGAYGINAVNANPKITWSNVQFTGNLIANLSANMISTNVYGANGALAVNGSSGLKLTGSTSGSAVAQASSVGELILSNNQGNQSTFFNDGGHGTAFVVAGIGSAIANKITAVPGATGNAPVINASGTDTNVNLALTSQGNGVVKFGSSSMFTANGAVGTSMTSVGPTGSHTTVQTWLTIVDNTGTTRYIPCY
jgi:hypothetical protein